MNYDVVIPVVRRNLSILKIGVPYIIRNLQIKKIVLIASGDLEKECKELFPMCQFINEDKLLEGLSYEKVKELIACRDQYALKRTGWYLQQLLKMGYALKCKEEYYLTWDADTIPLKKITMFDELGRPYFDMKEEYNAPYFTTLKKILSIGKSTSDSFISEHMIFKVEYMREIISIIENNFNLKGDKFYEKILNSIREIDIQGSGFSEFETYGNYVNVVHKNSYQTRKISGLREGEKYFGNNPTIELLDWASDSYEIITFENRGKTQNIICDNINAVMKEVTLKSIVETIYK